MSKEKPGAFDCDAWRVLPLRGKSEEVVVREDRVVVGLVVDEVNDLFLSCEPEDLVDHHARAFDDLGIGLV